jgi:ATP-dependent Clp protease ATP-binding subunit ClpX
MNFPNERQYRYDNDESSRHVHQALRDFVRRLPVVPPIEITSELEMRGYKGQLEQRQAVALMAYRHIRRLKRLYVDGEEVRALPPKQNLMLVGPTGCGKTFLIELLFQHIFKFPTVIVDITSFTEAGYIGDDVRTILTRLIEAAGSEPFLAAIGVVCLDEFDKIAASTSNARFAGQGTTKDVSGYGVQRELLAMLEGKDLIIPMDYGFSEYGQRSTISTRHIPFIACGAFSGFEELQKQRANIGFGSKEGLLPELTVDEVGLFQKYGFLPELIGRFARIVTFPGLSEETLKTILNDNIIPQFQNEFRGEGLELKVSDAAMDYLVKRSKKRGTGARGLHTELVKAIEEAAFATFGRKLQATIEITCANDHLESKIHHVT